MKSPKKKTKISIKYITMFIMTLICLGVSGYFLYAISLLSGIENKVRIILALIIVVLTLIFIIGLFKSRINKNKKYLFYIPVIIIYSIGLTAFSYYIIKTYKVVDNFTTNTTTYSSSLVTLNDNKVDNIKNVTGKVGIINDEENIIGYQIPKEVIKNEKLKIDVEEYESYVELIKALYDKEIEYAFLPTNYIIMFSSYDGADFSKLDEDTKIIYTKEKEVEMKSENKSSGLTEPFTILLMGVDSENEEIKGSSFNGDSLMLITFNPNTLNATLLSIPRDTYVPITCFAGKKKNKITHAAWYGEDCMIDTIENFTGITIDYYVKINFKGLVKMVDTLGGIEVDIPYSFCEQNSDRKFGNDTIYVEQGLQTLNGEQALAFARNRHTWPKYCGAKYSNYESNDFIRGQNQQTVLKAMLNKIKENGSLDTIYKLLDAVSASMETNMTNNEILSLYNIGKDVIAKSLTSQNVDDIIGMQRLYLSGKDAYIYDASYGQNLYNYVLYKESLNAVVEAMKINLGLIQPTMIKEFSFNIDEEYQQTVIGEMYSGTTESYETGNKTATTSKDNDKEETLETVITPNFVGMTYNEAKTKANSIGLYLNVPSTIKTTDIIATQDVKSGTEIKSGSTIKLTVKEEIEQVTVPNFVKMTYSDAKKQANSLGIYLNPSTANDTDIVIAQDTPKGTVVNKGVTIKLTLESENTEENSSDSEKEEAE